MKPKTPKPPLNTRPPIVTVLGHVDHGKTTLLDTIRNTNVTQSEAGGITQHIGAYQVQVKSQSIRQAQDKKSKVKSEEGKITFIDTPGHEAFAKMRARGSQVADLAILVVSATDGVMPQTEEAIKHIQKAQIPMIVAVNKMDLPEADPEKVKQQLAKTGVLVEKYGGDVVLVPISAKTGKGITELLDIILLVSELKNIQADPQSPLEAVVIETKLDKKRGVLATVIVKNGTISIGQTIYAEVVKAKVKALFDDRGKPVLHGPPSMPVEIMGWEALPQVGAQVYTELKELTDTPGKFLPKPFSLPPLTEAKKLKLILKADAAGSLEAILGNLGENVEIVSSATGEISESDVLLAKSTGAFILGFNLKAGQRALKLAEAEKVRIKTYTIIYELLDEISEVVELLNAPQAQEEVLGEANILALFSSDDQSVAGCKVTKGRIARGDLAKILRQTEEIGRGRIKSMRRGKDDVSKVEVGNECGLVFDKKLDFKVGDLIIAYRLHELLA